jgi:hypothetical protein
VAEAVRGARAAAREELVAAERAHQAAAVAGRDHEDAARER